MNILGENFKDVNEVVYFSNIDDNSVSKMTVGEALEIKAKDFMLFKRREDAYTHLVIGCKEYRILGSQVDRLLHRTSKYKNFFTKNEVAEHVGALLMKPKQGVTF